MTGTLIDIGNGQCLDPQRLPKPWVLVQVTKGGLTFRAETDALKIPHRPPDPEGHVFEEQAYVTVGVGIPWQPQGSVVAEPATIDSNIARGIFTEVEPPWIKGRDRWRLQVYRLGGEAFYISPDRLVQCRNSTPDTAADWPNPFIQCQIIAFDGAAGIHIKVSSEAVPVLPDVLTKIYEAVEALRHPCPSL